MYTYAFLKLPETPLKLPVGIAENLQLIAGDCLSALVEPGFSLEAIQNDEAQLMQAVLSHDRVICELFEHTVILPLRFGTYFVSAEAILAHLKIYQRKYLQQLSYFAGKAEYTLKLVPLEPPATSLSSEAKGKQYFLAKKQRYQTQQDFQNQQAIQWQQMLELMLQAYPDTVISSPQGKIEKIYFLVNRYEASLLYERLQAWQQLASGWELHLGEPLPPYHFVGDTVA